MLKIKTIYLDMDGVLCDFVKRYRELYGMEPSAAERDNKFDHLFANFIHTQQFATLDWMPGGQGLLAIVNTYKNVNIEILSSTANKTWHDDISRQKSIWLDTHNISYKRNFVPGKKFKYLFAFPDSILIDDTPVNIDDWNSSGGVGILHTSLANTMAELKKYNIGD